MYIYIYMYRIYPECIYVLFYFRICFFPKGHLQWVSASEAVAATLVCVYIYI